MITPTLQTVNHMNRHLVSQTVIILRYTLNNVYCKYCLIKGSQSVYRVSSSLVWSTWNNLSKMWLSFVVCGVIYLFIVKSLHFYFLSVTSLKDGDKHSALYQRFYQHFHGDGAKQPADCVVISLNNQKLWVLGTLWNGIIDIFFFKINILECLSIACNILFFVWTSLCACAPSVNWGFVACTVLYHSLG